MSRYAHHHPEQQCPACHSYGWMQHYNVNRSAENPNGDMCRDDWHTAAREAGLPATWTPRPCGEGEDE